MMTRALFLAALATSFTACGVPDDAGDDVIDLSDLDAKTDNVNSAKSALPAGATHLYFESPDSAYVSSDSPLSYTWFTAQKGAQFKLGVAELDENGNPVATEHVGFKLQRAVKSHGKWSWSVVASADSDAGSAAVKYSASTGPGLYLVTATGSPLPVQLTINLSCGNNACATAQEPGQTCGGFAGFQCDSGLYCQYPIAAQCGAGDQAGTCAITPRVCPLFYRPICGCNGKTYGNECQAGSAGTSMNRVGPCDVNVVGSWSTIASNGSHYDYTFSADGTFMSVQQPACAFTMPSCKIKIAPNYGNYSVTTTDLFLNYGDGWRSGETADFSIQQKGTHLVGTDYTLALDLTRK